MKRLAYGVATVASMVVPTSWRKCLSMNKELLFFRMVSSSIPIVRGLWATGGRVLVCNFMWCSTDSMPSSCGMFV